MSIHCEETYLLDLDFFSIHPEHFMLMSWSAIENNCNIIKGQLNESSWDWMHIDLTPISREGGKHGVQLNETILLGLGLISVDVIHVAKNKYNNVRKMFGMSEIFKISSSTWDQLRSSNS